MPDADDTMPTSPPVVAASTLNAERPHDRVEVSPALCPTSRFRWKVGHRDARLQQLHTDTAGWHRYWINVPAVAEDAPDVE